jgi:hypothetical protein
MPHALRLTRLWSNSFPWTKPADDSAIWDFEGPANSERDQLVFRLRLCLATELFWSKSYGPFN